MAADELYREGKYLWRFVLPGAPDGALLEDYARAHEHVFGEGASSLPVDVKRIVDEGLDAEALELVLRRRDAKNALTQKMQILVYLAEARQAHLGSFQNERPAPLRAFAHLSLATVRTAALYARGRLLLARHRLT